MAIQSDITSVIVGAGGPTVTFAAGSITVTVVEAQNVGMVGVPIPAPFSVLEVATQGIQGPKGDQNVYVSTTAPANPQLNWIWVKI
jgi:hypothetical protein